MNILRQYQLELEILKKALLLIAESHCTCERNFQKHRLKCDPCTAKEALKKIKL